MKGILGATALGLICATASVAADRTYDLDGFTAVSSASGVEVQLQVGADYSVTADAKRGKIERLKISLSGDTLMIDRKTGLLGAGKRDRFVVYVSAPMISEFYANSGSSMNVAGQLTGDITGSSSSGATLDFDDLATGQTEITSSSGASVQADGTCDSLEGTSSSGASFNAKRLTCDIIDVTSSSGASMRISASQSAKAHASSGGSIRVYGSPDVTDYSKSSGGSVKAR